MSRIRGENTKPELFVERVLKESGVAFARHTALTGRPDFVIVSKKVALFVDGDFWHGYRMGPKALSSLGSFWQGKITRNKKRDKLVNHRLGKEGWTVCRIWEHDIERNPVEATRRILELVRPSR